MMHMILLTPVATLFVGLLLAVGLDLMERYVGRQTQWLVLCLGLSLSIAQCLLLYLYPPMTFLRGGLVLDGFSQIMSLCALIMGLQVMVTRSRDHSLRCRQQNILFYLLILLSVIFIQSNRLVFGVLSLLAFTFVSPAVLAAGAPLLSQATLVRSGLMKSLIVFVVSIFLTVFSMVVFGETQFDEIQGAVSLLENKEVLVFIIQILILFLGFFTMAIPPFHSVNQFTRQWGEWSLSLGVVSFYAIMGFNVFIRWLLIAFSKANADGHSLDLNSQFDIQLVLQMLTGFALMVGPILSLTQNNMRRGLFYLVVNPFVQALFVASFGERDALGVAVGHVFLSVLAVGFLATILTYYNLHEKWDYGDWFGFGRRHPVGGFMILAACAAFAGMSPFFGSFLLQKTLRINSNFSLLLLFNTILSGYYVARLSMLAFASRDEAKTPLAPSPIGLGKIQKLWCAGQLMILLILGVFWQLVYDFGIFSVKGFFNDL